MSLFTLLLGKISVGAFFAIIVASVAAFFGIVFLDTNIAQPALMIAGIILGSFTFSAMGVIFGSIPTHNPGDVQMPSTLIRWILLFVSGVFVPLADMSATARGFSYLSPLTYAQDLMNHAVLGMGELNIWLDLSILFISGILFLLPSIKLHKRGRVLGY
jgi:ABC-2 type transport system permease protein